MTGRTCLPVLIAFCSGLWLVRSQTFDPRTERNLGVAAFKGGDCPEAIQHLERAVSVDPKDATAHFYLGLTYDECMCSSPNGCDSRWSEGAIEEYKLAKRWIPSTKRLSKTWPACCIGLVALMRRRAFIGELRSSTQAIRNRSTRSPRSNSAGSMRESCNKGRGSESRGRPH